MFCEFGINLAMLYKGNLIVNQLWEIRSGLGVVEGNPIREDGTIDYCQLHHVKVVTFVVCHPILFCVFFWPSFVAESSGRFNFGLYILLRRQKLDFDLMTKEGQFFYVHSQKKDCRNSSWYCMLTTPLSSQDYVMVRTFL